LLASYRAERVGLRHERDLRRVAGRGRAARARIVGGPEADLQDDRVGGLREQERQLRLVVSPLSATGVPLTCDDSNFAARRVEAPTARR
jgi:hypothetical protein